MLRASRVECYAARDFYRSSCDRVDVDVDGEKEKTEKIVKASARDSHSHSHSLGNSSSSSSSSTTGSRDTQGRTSTKCVDALKAYERACPKSWREHFARARASEREVERVLSGAREASRAPG